MLKKVDIGISHGHEVFGNPGPLGLLGLAIATSALVPLSLGYFPAEGPKATFMTAAVWALLFGGGCQFLAGIMDFANKNSFGGTIFTCFSFMWAKNAWFLYLMANGFKPDHFIDISTDVTLLAIFAVLTYGFGFFSKNISGIEFLAGGTLRLASFLSIINLLFSSPHEGEPPMSLLKKVCYGIITLSLCALPVCAQEWDDGTHLFEEETRWLADNAAKETKMDFEIRTKGVLQSVDQKPAQVGDEVTFNTFNIAEKKHEPVVGVLKKIGKRCYIFVQKGKNVAAGNLTRIMNTFDDKIYKTNTSTFGAEWTPGIDGDPKITLFLLDIQDGFNPKGPSRGFTAGYFYAGDEYTREKNPSSNEREMIYLDLYPGDPAKERYLSVVAHEFQHMIHWHHDPKEYTWVNESMSQLATYLNGYGHPSQVLSFLKTPDNSLCAWASDNMLANYGQVYLFAYYILTHSGAGTDTKERALIKAIVESDARGANGFEAALKKIGRKELFSDLFREFCVANYLNNPKVGRGEYGYNKELAKLKLEPMKKHDKAPFVGKGTVKCWSAQAVVMDLDGCEGEGKLSFAGQTQQAEQKYRNTFDVAAIFCDTKNRQKPVLKWLSLKENRGEESLGKPGPGLDQLMLVICNRGPEGAVETPFAASVPPAKFSYSLAVAKKGNSLKVASNPNRRVSRRTMNTIVEKIVACSQKLEEMPPELSDSTDSTSSENFFGTELDRLTAEENLVADSVHAMVVKGDNGMLEDFMQMYGAAPDSGKKSLAGLYRKILDKVRFEVMQNNRTELKTFLP